MLLWSAQNCEAFEACSSAQVRIVAESLKNLLECSAAFIPDSAFIPESAFIPDCTSQLRTEPPLL